MKKIILIIVILAIIVIGFMLFRTKTQEVADDANETDALKEIIENDTVGAIEKDFGDEINIGDTNEEFKSLESDLQSL